MSVKMRFAVVCSSNMNRSMEAHAFLQKKGYDIHSYGTGDKIKIPGT
jgi:RNA polymerase II subunit A C-terminal domain phosphatase SSU72